MDDKLHRMLLWSAIGSMFSSITFVALIARKLTCDSVGEYPVRLAVALGVIVALAGGLKFCVWKHIRSNRNYRVASSSSVILYNIKKLTGQRKLIIFYLLEISVQLLIAFIFFFAVIHNGFYQLSKFTAPIIAVTYVLGFYFIMSFTRQIRKFSRMKKQADQLNLKHVSQN